MGRVIQRVRVDVGWRTVASHDVKMHMRCDINTSRVMLTGQHSMRKKMASDMRHHTIKILPQPSPYRLPGPITRKRSMRQKDIGGSRKRQGEVQVIGSRQK